MVFLGAGFHIKRMKILPPPTAMHGWLTHEKPDGFLYHERCITPHPGKGEVLIKVAAAGVNRADLYQAEGNYPLKEGASPIPGLELAGQVVAVGTGVDSAMVGQYVAALVDGGAYAEYALADSGLVFPVPSKNKLSEAAALPEALMTGWMALKEGGQIRRNETVLLYGAAGGIGPVVARLAMELGARVIGTASSDERCALLKQIGILPVNHRTQNLPDAVKELTGGRGADVIIDNVGGSRAQENIAMAAIGGRIVTLAMQGGAEAHLRLGGLLVKQLNWRGMLLRPQKIAKKRAWARVIRENHWPYGRTSGIRPVIDRVMPLAEANRALSILRQHANNGKIILTT